MPLEQKGTEWWYRVRDPGKYRAFYSVRLGSSGVRKIIGKLSGGKTETQSLRFDKKKFKTANDVREYVRKHPEIKR